MPILTALAAASAALTAVKTLVNAGRDIEDCVGQLGKWFSAVSDIQQAEQEAANPPLFRKLLHSGSVEEEALQATVARQKLQEQERELRELITYRYGLDVYRQMLRMRREIKEKRQNLIYKQRKRRRALLDAVLITILIAMTIAILSGMVWLIVTKGGQ